jgi:cyclopropane-fatty-acyl-phospholipid synthase
MAAQATMRRAVDAAVSKARAALATVAARLEVAGASLTVEAPGGPPLRVGAQPDAAWVRFREPAALAALARGDHLALAEAYLHGAIELDGDLAEVMKVTDLLTLDESRWDRVRLALGLFLRGRRAMNREAIAFHYDRPPEFFLPWLERWRSYSHGFWAGPDDDPSAAQARKLRHAIDALGLRPGDRVLDMGAGWGSFLEYAGLQGIRVHGITISREQQRFCETLIRERGLPCTVELVDFFAYRPREPFAGAVFLGTFEHVGDYGYAARFLAAHLRPGARVYADFVARREGFRTGRFLSRWIFPGTTSYVDLAALVRALGAAGFHLHELGDDALSYAFTVRDWARRLESQHKTLAEHFGEPAVRAFLLYLWGSHHFLLRGHTLAYHLVAGREPRAPGRPMGGLAPASTQASAAAPTHAKPNASPIRA